MIASGLAGASASLGFPLSAATTRALVRAALDEDHAFDDVTTLATVPAESLGRAAIVARSAGVIAGLPLAITAFETMSREVTVRVVAGDGEHVGAGGVVAEVAGPWRALLSAERVALNFVQRLSGVATLTARYVEAVRGTNAKIYDTRKTTPTFRALEKYAVRCGGGANHRAGLYDAVLVKENHLRIAGGIAAAVAALDGAHDVEVEAETLDQVREALAAGVGRILLDNMSPEQVADAVAVVDGRAQLEASGGISLATVRSYAETGVDFISVGALTHGARSLHVSLEVS